MNIYKTKNIFKKRSGLVVVFTAAITGVMLVGLVSASTRGVSFEAEQSAGLSECTSSVNDAVASGEQALLFDCPEQEGFIHPGVVYTRSDIDSWSTSSAEYTRLADTCGGTVSPSVGSSCYGYNTPIVFGERIDTGGTSSSASTDPENEINKGTGTQSGYAKVQAVLWAADNNPARRDKVIAYLKEYRSVTSYEWSETERHRLVSGWGCTNLAQAAEIINYQDEQFKRFLGEVCWPVLDWPSTNNWQASFADSRLSIAAYLGDEAKWQEAKAYYYKRIKQNIWLSEYDGSTVFPVHTNDTVLQDIIVNGTKVGTATTTNSDPTGTVHTSRTQQAWGSTWGPSQVNSNLTFNTQYGPPVEGMNGERTRDLSHVNLALAAWVHGARTIQAQGEQLEQHAYDRIMTAYDYHAQRCLAYLQTGEIPSPVPHRGVNGTDYLYSWEGAAKLLGEDTPDSVLNILQRSEVKNRPAVGKLHMSAELFADS